VKGGDGPITYRLCKNSDDIQDSGGKTSVSGNQGERKHTPSASGLPRILNSRDTVDQGPINRFEESVRVWGRLDALAAEGSPASSEE
jgi:hypothetical protein